MEQIKKESKKNKIEINIKNNEDRKEDDFTHQLSQFKYKQFSTYNIDLFRSSKLLKTFTEHNNNVYSIDYSTFYDGQFICSGSGDNTVRVWDIEDNSQIQSFNGHSKYVYCTIRFWDFKDNKQLKLLNEYTDWVGGIEFSPFYSGRYLCSGSGDKTIHLWDVETFKSLHVFNGHAKGVWCVDFSPLQSGSNNSEKINNIGVIGGNGYTICSGSNDKTICMWDIETAKQIIVFKGHKDCVRNVKYGRENTILSGSEDKSVCLWDIRSGQPIQQFKGHKNFVYAVEYSPFIIKDIIEVVGSNVLCSGSLDNTIRFWDIRSNKNELFVIKGDEKEDKGILCLKFMSLKKKVKSNEQKANGDCVNLCYGSTKGPIRVWG
ncbi:WD-40 repeat protein [Reticulomyxa filosa]|uniref:WD-40 repeat protein n=1 Tax=Reticulomyxa filosa TaxID=46433 RepID=X6MS84_RETFI|nr:WD-40 repeat protein [Reticulomyxa filosa]|eukprot:ETO15935.1 WD-40 repeat protein [Reticulomyxa filosa]